jgi:hypothetical protein
VLPRTTLRLLRVPELRTTVREPTTIAELRVRVRRTIIPLPRRVLDLQKTSRGPGTTVEFHGQVLPRIIAI